MASLISVGANNVQPNGFNNIYVHEFRGSSVNLQNCEVAVASVNVLNSVYNIDSSLYANNTLAIEMPTGSGVSTINITVNDGLLSYANLSQYIQAKLKEAGAYLINNDGLDVHYFQLAENPAYYAAQVDLSPVPTTLPSGWSLPSSGLYSSSPLPTTTRVPRLIINNAAFGKIIGFEVGGYPAAPQTTLQSLLSNITPTAHPIINYRIRCSLINNPYMFPSDIVGSFNAAGVAAGKLIVFNPNEYLWINVPDGSYASIRFTITDQNDNFVRLRDPADITIAIRQKK